MTSTYISQHEILEKMVCIIPKVRKYGGEKSLAANEVPDTGGNVVKWGTKSVIDSVHLRSFNAISMSVARTCLKYGTKILNNIYLVPEDVAAALCIELDKLKAEWDVAVETFTKHYPAYVLEWANNPDNATWHQSILDAAPDLNSVTNSFAFGVARFKAGSFAVGSDAQDSDNLLLQEVEGLSGQVLKEVAFDLMDSVKDVSKNRVKGSKDVVVRARDTYTQDAVEVVLRCRDKLERFIFLDPALGVAVSIVDKTLDLMPREGKIIGHEFLLLQGLISLLKDPARVSSLKDGDNLVLYTQKAVPPTPIAVPSQPVDDLFSQKVDTQLASNEESQGISEMDADSMAISDEAMTKIRAQLESTAPMSAW